MATYSKHIKQIHLKQLVEQNKDCDSILTDIRQLVGLPPKTPDNDNNEETTPKEVADLEAPPPEEQILKEKDSKTESIERILEGLSGKEEKLARQLLNEIEKSPLVSWDPLSLELIRNGKPVSNTSMSLFVSKIVKRMSNAIPYGFLYFIDSLISAKVPISYFKDSDSLNFREALLKIEKSTATNNVSTTVEPEAVATGEKANEPEIEATPSLKRARNEEESDNEEERDTKKLKRQLSTDFIDDLDLGGGEEGGGGGREETVEEPTRRRSARLKLKNSLRKSWKKLTKN